MTTTQRYFWPAVAFALAVLIGWVMGSISA
jgi:hypothetical protein